MDLLEKAVAGRRLSLEEIEALFDYPLPELAAAAHEARRRSWGSSASPGSTPARSSPG